MMYVQVRTDMHCFGVQHAYIQGDVYLVTKTGRVEFDLVCPESVQELDFCPGVSALPSPSGLTRYTVQYNCVVEEPYKPSYGFQMQVYLDTMIETDLAHFELGRYHHGPEVVPLSRREAEQRMSWAYHLGYYVRNPNVPQYQKVTLKQFDLLKGNKCPK